MTKAFYSYTALFTGILCNTVPRFLDFSASYDSAEYIRNYWLYSQGQGLSFLLILLAGYFKPYGDKPLSIIFELCIWLAVSNFMDEVLFDPVHFGFNEIAFALIIISHAVFQYRTYNKSKKIDNA